MIIMTATQALIENIIPILWVKNLTASVEWYDNVLGFTQEWAVDDFTELSRDGASIHLCENCQGQSGTWLWIGVQDVDKLYEECKSKGATIRMEMTSFPWAREFNVTDPDGHVLRFGGAPEGHKHDHGDHKH